MGKTDPIMAGVTIAAGAFGDPRFDYLAELMSYADADHARGKMAKLISRCTALGTSALPPKVIVVCLGKLGPEAIVEADLGELLDDGTIRVKGCEGRTEWLAESADRGTTGGVARATSAKRERGRFVRSTTNDREHPPATDQQPPFAGASLAPANQRPPDQDQDLDLRERADRDPDRGVLVLPLRVPALIGGGDQAQARGRVVSELMREHVAVFNRVRAQLGAKVPAMAAIGDPAERALHELVRAQPTLEGFVERARHVLAVREDEAVRRERSVKFLGASVWNPDSFAIALQTQVGEDRKPTRAAGRAPPKSVFDIGDEVLERLELAEGDQAS